MFDIPAFFIDQQVDQDADERTIKRAYAKALKLIDQDNDLAGFQELRESYERALAWARSKEWREQIIAEQDADVAQSQDATTSDIVVVPNSTDEAQCARAEVQEVLEVREPSDVSTAADVASESAGQATVDAEISAMSVDSDSSEPVIYAIDVARTIFAEFLQTLAEKSDEAGQTEIVLRAYMDDDRLINVEIRDLFEWLIAERLAQGWQVGNGDLFGASVKCFGWNQDRNRLLRFQEFGYYLDRAVDEMSAFNLQEEARSNRQVNLIRLARNDAPPTKQFLRENIYFINDMMASYPTWLAMVTKFENLETWHKRAEEYKFFQPPKIGIQPLKNFFTNNEWSFVVVFCLFVILSTAFSRMISIPSSQRTEKTFQNEPISIHASSLDLVKQGTQFLKGIDGFEKDESRALLYFNKASENGYLEADIQIARMYQDKSSDLYDLKSAHVLMLKVAEAGMVDAWVEVAGNFENGIGVDKDPKKATYWYTRATNFGNGAAMNNLAVKYQNGRGVKLDKKQAVMLYEAAANKGNAMAQLNIGLIYLEGRLNTKADEKVGLHWLKMSAENGNETAQYIRAEILEYGKYGETKNLEEAELLYWKAKENGKVGTSESLMRVCEKLKRTNCSTLKSNE